METRKTVRDLVRNRKVDESGYALVLALGIVILTIAILSSMTILTIKDVKNSTKNRGVLEARISGESALDSLYAAINTGDGSKDILTALSSFKSFDGTQIVDLNNSTTLISSNETRTIYPFIDVWFGIDENGSIINCPAAKKNTTPCFKIRLIKIITTPDYTSDFSGQSGVEDISDSREEYVIDIVTRTKCDSGTTNNCSYSRIQQNITLRKYIEYVSLSTSESVAPVVKNNAGVPAEALNQQYSLSNYYSGQDDISGKIHTNDTIIRACNNFNNGVASWITAKGNGLIGVPATGIVSTAAGCDLGPTSIDIKKATRAPLALPDRIGDTNAVGLLNLANSDGNNYVIHGDHKIVFSVNANSVGVFKVDGDPEVPMPPSGVLFLDGESSISGTVKGKITIASAVGKSITIDGDLKYAAGANASNKEDMLGVYSGKDIVVDCRNTGTGPCQSTEIDGFLKANTDSSTSANLGTIYNPKWATSQVATAGLAPKLTLFGAMESYYRGTFGSINSRGDTVVTGFQKAFTFDSRLTYEQPPFMLRDGTIPFIRNAIKDIPCSTFCNN